MQETSKSYSLVNTYSGLVNYFTKDKPELKEKFSEFADKTHLYDPQFYLPNKVNLFTAVLGNKYGNNIKFDKIRLLNLCEALTLSIYITQLQVHYAKDLQTGEFLLPRGTCLIPDDILVKKFLHNKLLKYLTAEYLPNTKLIPADELNAKIDNIISRTKKYSHMIWSSGEKCKAKFVELGYGNGYIYGQRKEYKKHILTKKDIAILKYFVKRGESDIKQFTKEAEEKGLSETFKEWYRGKKFMNIDITAKLLDKGIGLRSKAFKRFSAKLEGANFDRIVNEFAEDKRKKNKGTIGNKGNSKKEK